MSEIAVGGARDHVQRYIESRGNKPLVSVTWHGPEDSLVGGHRQPLVGRQALGPEEGLRSPAAATRWLREHGITSGATVEIDGRHVPVSFTAQIDTPTRQVARYSLERVERGTWNTRKIYTPYTSELSLKRDGFYRHGKMPVTDVLAGNELLSNRGTIMRKNIGTGLFTLAMFGAVTAMGAGIMWAARDGHPGEQQSDPSGDSGWPGGGESDPAYRGGDF